MNFEYFCFFSYPRLEASIKFTEKFKKDLSYYLEPHCNSDFQKISKENKGIFLDTTLRPGVPLNASLAEKLCRSICLVIFYWHNYFEKEYCCKEVLFFARLQEKRQNKLIQKYNINPNDVNQIITIIIDLQDQTKPLREDPLIPDELKGTVLIDISSDDKRLMLHKEPQGEIFDNLVLAVKKRIIYAINLHRNIKFEFDCHHTTLPDDDDNELLRLRNEVQLNKNYIFPQAKFRK